MKSSSAAGSPSKSHGFFWKLRHPIKNHKNKKLARQAQTPTKSHDAGDQIDIQRDEPVPIRIVQKGPLEVATGGGKPYVIRAAPIHLRIPQGVYDVPVDYWLERAPIDFEPPQLVVYEDAPEIRVLPRIHIAEGELRVFSPAIEDRRTLQPKITISPAVDHERHKGKHKKHQASSSSDGLRDAKGPVKGEYDSDSSSSGSAGNNAGPVKGSPKGPVPGKGPAPYKGGRIASSSSVAIAAAPVKAGKRPERAPEKAAQASPDEGSGKASDNGSEQDFVADVRDASAKEADDASPPKPVQKPRRAQHTQPKPQQSDDPEAAYTSPPRTEATALWLDARLNEESDSDEDDRLEAPFEPNSSVASRPSTTQAPAQQPYRPEASDRPGDVPLIARRYRKTYLGH